MRFMGVDQYGQTYHRLECPRRDLLKTLGSRHAQKMYCDTKSGKPQHIGYVIAGLWIRVYEVKPWKEAA